MYLVDPANDDDADEIVDFWVKGLSIRNLAPINFEALDVFLEPHHGLQVEQLIVASNP
jgi:hypothetical protein